MSTTLSQFPAGDQPPSGSPPAGDALLRVAGLTKYFPVKRGIFIRQTIGQVQAVDGISF